MSIQKLNPSHSKFKSNKELLYTNFFACLGELRDFFKILCLNEITKSCVKPISWAKEMAILAHFQLSQGLRRS